MVLERSLRRLWERSGTANWTAHDVRRTVRTELGAMGTPPHVSELLVAHAPAGLVATYDRGDYLVDRANALEGWAVRLRGIV